MEQFQHTIIFDDEINVDSVQELIDDMSTRSFVNLYFSTNGGYIAEMYALIDYLNYRYKVGTLKLFLDKYVVSAGTILLLEYEGPIFITRDFYGFMFHMPDISLYGTRKSGYEDGARRILAVRNNKYINDLSNLGLTSKQIKDIRDGKDVYIFVDEIHKLKRQLFSSVEEEITQNYTTFKF